MKKTLSAMLMIGMLVMAVGMVQARLQHRFTVEIMERHAGLVAVRDEVLVTDSRRRKRPGRTGG